MASLTEYQRKRKFDLTPEPRGKTQTRPANRFVVQEHHARRLHYDFRLEVNGVLKSWAVPKGPSLNPGDKRLAIQTEDHPLEYRAFEGVIPAGNYGAGQVSIWDEGTFEMEGPLSAQQQIDRGELKFKLYGHRLHGSFVLVKIRGGSRYGKDTGKEWLLIKHADEGARPDWKMEEVSSEDSASAAGVPRATRQEVENPGYGPEGANARDDSSRSGDFGRPSLFKPGLAF